MDVLRSKLVRAMLILGIALVFAAPVAHAQPTTTSEPPPESGSAAGSTATSVACALGPGLCAAAALVPGVADVGSEVASYAGTAILDAIAAFILTFANLLLGIAGSLFNLAVVKTVFQFSAFFGNSPGLLAAWAILRDIGNMLLLFGFIFIGIAMILDLHSYPAKKTLPRLIIFAILMNFSLFAAQAVIDVSNGLSSALYTQANTDQCGSMFDGYGATESKTYDEAREQLQNDCLVSKGLAGSIMQATGLGSIFRADDQGVVIGAAVMLGLALFATIGAVVLFAGAIMLIIRAVVLMLLMVAAPLGFAALAIPPLQKHGEQWWGMLLSQSFFAPVFLLLLLVSLKISEAFANTGTTGSLAGALSQPNASVMQIFLVFFLICGLLVASLLAAKKAGAMGSTFAINMGTKYAFGGLARKTNLAFGGAAYGLQALKVRSDARYKERTGLDRKQGVVGRFVMNKGLKPLANANMDMRRLPGMGSVLGAAGATVGAKPGEHISFEEMKHRYEEIRDDIKGKEKDRDHTKKVNTRVLIDAIDGLKKGIKLSPETERFLAGLSADEIAANHDLQHNIAGLAEMLTPDQFEGMMKSDKVDPGTKDDLAAARYAEAGKAIGSGFAGKDVIRKLSNKDLEMLAKYNPGLFNQMLEESKSDPASGEGMLSGDQNDALVKSNALTNSQRAAVRAQTKVARVEEAVKNSKFADAAKWAATMNSKTKAKLNAAALTNADIINTFTVGDLKEIQREAKLVSAEAKAIGAEIKKTVHPNYDTIKEYLKKDAFAKGYWG